MKGQMDEPAKVEGIVIAVSQKEKKYGVKVKEAGKEEGEWYNGWGTCPVVEGDIVTIEYEDREGEKGVFHNIKEIALKSDTETVQALIDAQAQTPASDKKPAGTKETAEKTLSEDIQHAILNVMKIKMDCAAIVASAMQGNIDSPQKSDIYFRNVGRLFKWITGSDEIP